ncbi:MAG TPA: prenyltransferase/squalene oxidase repeat-containing protein [Gemmataceae bacterium]|jgi:hypothetical protein|nr:prenyltransferase/squalene oxidase repeat-containing protein [Gemmataceae bacterium]
MNHFLWSGAIALAAGIVLTVPARAVDKEQVKRAVTRGVGYLKSLQTTGGAWPTQRLGATALAGLTLLECDVAVNDPAVEKAAHYVRRESLEFNETYATYSLALTILFLDRLGETVDEPLIQVLAVRILAGQNSSGGWGYACPVFNDDDAVRLRTLINQRAELVAKKELPKPQPAEHGSRPRVPTEILQLVARVDQGGPHVPEQLDALFPAGDNSNTQFAVLALWTARRHGIPVEKALTRTSTRFRTSQNSDGGWGYRPEAGSLLPGFSSGSTPSMTCAGLLGVALGHGIAGEVVLRTDGSLKKGKAGAPQVVADPARDPVIRKGLLALGTVMARPMGQELPALVPEGTIRNINTARDYYFLWSLERVAIAYDLATIGRKDWYSWGGSAILAAQRPDGGWRGKHGEDVDTCFALLFLRRANLARDLTAYLKGKMLDPAQVTLKSGGNRGEELGDSMPPARNTPSKESNSSGAQTSSRKSRPLSPDAPASSADPEATRLSKEVVEATGRRQDELIDKLQESKGVVHTEALATAIPHLAGAARTRARTALAHRLSRMTPATLRDKFADDNPEIRRAAALACTAKADKQFVPNLIALLEDPEPGVAHVAHAALKDLTGQDFAASATRKWQVWWKTQSRN